jgi:hypothetical protein
LETHSRKLCFARRSKQEFRKETFPNGNENKGGHPAAGALTALAKAHGFEVNAYMNELAKAMS